MKISKQFFRSHEDKGSKLTELACPLCSHVFKNLATYEKHLASHQSMQQDNIQAGKYLFF